MTSPETARQGVNQRAADSKNKQVKSYQICIPAQVKTGKSGRPAIIIPVVVLSTKNKGNGYEQ